MTLASPPVGPTPALWVSTRPRSEADAFVQFFTAEGALSASAKGLLKPASKLAPLLKPGDELTLELARSRGPLPVLTGVLRLRAHPAWQQSLNHTALCWFMTECAYISAGDPDLNAALYQLVVNLLRSEPQAVHLPSAAVVFCLRLLALHGVMLNLGQCALSGGALELTEPAHLLPNGEGLVGRAAFNEHYARTGGGMPRLDPSRRQRWRSLARLPLLDYPSADADATDCALLVHLVEQQVANPAAQTLGSAAFLKQQWRLPAWPELCQTD
jgi:recombinational DNA repair protein (RecF pathway)